MSKINSLLMPFEIGDLFFTTNNTNPSNRFGGTWELYAKGKTIVGIDPDDSDFNSINKTGGEKAHTLIIDEMPSHHHQMYTPDGARNSDTGQNWSNQGINVGDTVSGRYTSNTGGDQPHNNLQPYIVSYIWIKTA